MTRLGTGLVAALAVGWVPNAELKTPTCKDRRCIEEAPEMPSEQPHTHQEGAEAQKPTKFVVIPMSPIITVPRNSPTHLEWIERYGAEGAHDIEHYTKSYLSDDEY